MFRKIGLLTAVALTLGMSTGCARWCENWCGCRPSTQPVMYQQQPQAVVYQQPAAPCVCPAPVQQPQAQICYPTSSAPVGWQR